MRSKTSAVLAILSATQVHAIQLVVINDTADQVILQSNTLLEQHLKGGEAFTFPTGNAKLDFSLTQLCDNKPRAKRRVKQTGALKEGVITTLPVSDILLQEPDIGAKEFFVIEEIK
jgi:hypothetical protein